jgi:hypothetical protein
MDDIKVTEIECNGVPITASINGIVAAINAQKDCSQKQLLKVVDAFCDAISDTRDYAAQQAAIVGKDLDSKLDALAEKVEAKADSGFTAEDGIKLVDEVKKAIDEATQKASDDLRESLKDELLIAEKITPEFVKTLEVVIDKLKDSNALDALVGIQNDLRNLNEKITELVTTSKDTADKVAAMEAKLVTQNNINCTLKQGFMDLSEAIVVDCEKQTTETENALSCVRASIGSKSQYEYQATANPADLIPAPAIVMPLVIADVIAPVPVVEPTYVVTSETIDGVLLEVLSDGNMRKTDVDGTVTVTNSMGDLVE